MSAADAASLDCSTDPGVLTTENAIFAMSKHHNCSPQCVTLRRAMDTLSTEFVEVDVERDSRLEAELTENLRWLSLVSPEILAR